MERESYIEIAAKHGKRIGNLELIHTDMVEKLRPDPKENPANPLTIFSKLRSLRESTDKNIILKGQSSLNIAKESVFAYAEASFAIGAIRKVILDAYRVQEIPFITNLTSSSLEFSILRDVVGIFGPKGTYENFKSPFQAGIAKGRQDILDSLQGKIPLMQYNRSAIERLCGPQDKREFGLKFPTSFEGIEARYEYNDNKPPEISIYTHPVA